MTSIAEEYKEKLNIIDGEFKDVDRFRQVCNGTVSTDTDGNSEVTEDNSQEYRKTEQDERQDSRVDGEIS